MKSSEVLHSDGSINMELVNSLASNEEKKVVEKCLNVSNCDKCKEAVDIYKCLMS